MGMLSRGRSIHFETDTEVATQNRIAQSHWVGNAYSVIRDCNPGSLFSILGSGIEESVIWGSRDPNGIIDCQKCVNVHGKKIVGFHCTATTSVHLVNENNVTETKKVQLINSISSY